MLTKTPVIVLLIFLGSLILLFGFLLVSPSLFTNYGLIKEFPDSNQKFVDEGAYQVTDRKLTNAERDKVIIPYDEIIYQFDVHNLKDYRTDIYYELEFFKGKDREGEIYNGTDQLKPKSTETQTINKIFLKTPGSYDIKLNLIYKNTTGKVYAQYATGFEGIEILSKSDQIQMEQNDYLLIGVIASFAIGIVTATALVVSVHYSREVVRETKRSNKLELTKNKPRFLIEHASYRIQHNMVWLNAEVVNTGNTSAENLRFSFVAKNHPFSVDEVISEMLDKNKNNMFDHHVGSLSSGHSSTIEASAVFPLKTEIVSIVLWFKYDFVEEKDHEEIHFLLFQKGVSPHYEFSIEDNKIKETKNRLKENKK